MPKKIIITTLIVLITIMFPVNLKASLIPKEISQNYIIYEAPPVSCKNTPSTAAHPAVAA